MPCPLFAQLDQPRPTGPGKSGQTPCAFGSEAEAAIPELVKRLQARNETVQQAIREALVSVGKEKRAEVLTALLTSLGDSDEEASARIREVLDGIGQLDVSDLHLLRRLLKVSTPSERARLLHALEKLHLKPPILVPLLTDALEFPDRAIRLWAVKGLGKIGASARGRGFAGLLAVLKDKR